MAIIRLLIQGTIVLGLLLGAISAFFRQRKVLALTGIVLGLTAAMNVRRFSFSGKCDTRRR